MSLQQKALGAFYTDIRVADFLVWWSVRTGHERILDPSFGGGVFLLAACERLRILNGKAEQVTGIEIDNAAYTQTAAMLWNKFGVPSENLKCADFFEVAANPITKPDVIVGNPPFIRYHRFRGGQRSLALKRAAAQSVNLSALSSSWAPFLIHGISLLQRGGRLAMVVPAEIAHASYALPVLNHLTEKFRSVTILTFRRRLFINLNEDTFLLLAEGKDEPFDAIRWRDFEDIDELARQMSERNNHNLVAVSLDHDALIAGRERLIRHLMPSSAKALYENLAQSGLSMKLGHIADVGIGYVTGANDFFHLNSRMSRSYEIPDSLLYRAIRRGRDLIGTRYTEYDWNDAFSRGKAVQLLAIKPESVLPPGVLQYIRRGEQAGVSLAYKCRVRSPWYCVPHIHRPDAFLAYMSGSFPRLVSNEAGAVAPNTLHTVRFRSSCPMSARGIAALWQTSLTRLSVEIEGHSLGGGMMKLEPGEARQVCIPSIESDETTMGALSEEIDRLQREGKEISALELADQEILIKRLGLSKSDVAILRHASDSLRERRCTRG